MTATSLLEISSRNQLDPGRLAPEQLQRELPQALLASLARPGDDARVAQAADLGRAEGQDIG